MPLNGDEYHDKNGPGILPGGLSVELPHRPRFITDRSAEADPSWGKVLRRFACVINPEPFTLKNLTERGL